MADYKISLGVDVDVSDIQSQINTKAGKIDKIPIKVEIENLKEIKKQIQSLGDAKTNKNLLTLNTESLEASLKDVSTAIKDIKASIGTLDSGSGMKSLLSSINQISNALEKASNQFEGLNASLNALSGKDLSLNFGINLGSSNSVARNAVYGSKVRNETLPQLKQQMSDLVKYYNTTYKQSLNEFEALQKLVSGTKLNNGDFFENFLFGKDSVASRMNGGSLASQMQAYKQYIDMFKQAASLKGLDLSSVTSSFSKSADDLIKDAQDIQTGAKEMEDSFEKLKQVFGGGNNLNIEGISTQLDSIVVDLGEIKTAIQGLSSGASLDGLTHSFNRLSETLENLVSNLTLAKNTLNTGFSNASSTGSAISVAQQTGQKIGEAIGKSAKQSINLDDVIDEQVLKIMNEYAIAGGKGSKAFDEIKQSLNDFRSGSGDINKVTSAISNNMKVVNEAKNDYKELADYIRMFNASGAKVHIPDSIRQEYGDDYKSMRSQLGKGFTSGQGMDFETFIVETNSILGDTIDLSRGAEAAFGDLVRKVNSTKGGKFLTGDDLFRNGILDMGDVVANVSTSLEQIENAEERIAQASTAASNTINQNEERKQQAYRETSGVIENLKTTLETMRVDRSSIDTVIKDMEELGFTATDTSVKMKNGGFDITVKGVDSIGRAITEIRHLDSATDEISLVDRKITQSLTETDRFVKQQKQAVSNLTNQINQLNRSAIDQNASRPIKDSAHLDALADKYDEITLAIQRMENASSDTFVDEQNNVKALISDYKSLVSEFKNAENVSSKMKGTDFASGLDIAKNDLEKFKAQAKDFPQITATIEDLDRAIEGVGDAASLNKFNDQLRVARSELAKVKSETTALNRSEKVGINVSGLESKIADLQRISPEVDKFEAEIDGAKVSVQSLLSDLKQVNTQSDFSVVNSKWKAFTDAAKAAGIAVTETATKARTALANDIKFDIDVGNFENEIDTMRSKFNSLSDANIDLRNSVELVENAYKEMLAAADANTGDEVADRERLIQAEKEYAAALEKTNNLIKQQARADKANADAIKLQDNRELFQGKIDVWMEKNSAAIKKFGAHLLDLRAKAETADQVELNHLEKELLKVDKAADKAGLKMQSLGDQIKSKFKEYMAYFSVAEVFMYVEQGLREMFNTVKEIDTAMTGLYRVTDLTASQYDALFNNMISSAKEYGATLNDIINATTDWVRAGFDADVALGMAEVTTMYQHISDLDYDTAAENLITAYNGFKNELNGAFDGDQVAAVNYIADILNELDKQNCP